MSGIHERVTCADNSRVEVDFFDLPGDDEVFIEVYDGSWANGNVVSACACLTPKKARKLAKILRKAAKAAGK